MKISLAGFSLLLFCALLVCASLYLGAPPAPAPATSPSEEFSAERAMDYVRLIAAKPHPAASAEHVRVRDAIVGELTKLGLAPQVRATRVGRMGFLVAAVENIVARLEGAENGPALLLMAHYDSVAAAPGAGDDASGCAVLLETLRALRAGTPLRNDVIFLFTDAEEDGLLGAAAFVAEHPWAKETGLVLNFDSRGNAGPAMMFETSEQNGRLVREFARAAPYPVGSSLMFEVYRRMPNDTDLSIFKRRGIAGMNIGFVGGWRYYHSAEDTSANLSPASLQHSGANALALARHFGNLDLTQTRDADAIYFDLPGIAFVHYPAEWARALAIVAGVLFLIVAVVQLARRRASLYGVVFGALALVVTMVLAVVAGALLWNGMNYAHKNWLPDGDIPRSALYALGMFAIGIALVTAVYGLLRRRFSAQSLALAAMLIWTAAAAATAWLIPGVSYLTVWPLACGLLATLFVGAGSVEDEVPRWAYLLLFPLALPVIFLFAPLLMGLFIGLGLGQPGTQALMSAMAAALLVLVPQIELMTRRGRGFLPVLAFVAGVALLASGAALTRFDAAYPKPSNALYLANADTGEALWATQGRALDPWTSALLSSPPAQGGLPDFFPERLGARFLWSPAPAAPLAPPQVTLVESKTSGDRRTLRLRLVSPRGARLLGLRVPDAEVVSARVDGAPVAGRLLSAPGGKVGWMFGFLNPPATGVEVLLELRGTGPVKLVATDRAAGLPALPGIALSRPGTTVPIHSGDQTVVIKSFEFPAIAVASPKPAKGAR